MAEKAATLKWLRDSLIAAERTKLAGEGRTGIRRLTRGEFENTMRDILQDV